MHNQNGSLAEIVGFSHTAFSIWKRKKIYLQHITTCGQEGKSVLNLIWIWNPYIVSPCFEVKPVTFLFSPLFLFFIHFFFSPCFSTNDFHSIFFVEFGAVIICLCLMVMFCSCFRAPEVFPPLCNLIFLSMYTLFE